MKCEEKMTDSKKAIKRQYDQKKYIKNREKICEQKRKHYMEHGVKEKTRERQKENYKTHKKEYLDRTAKNSFLCKTETFYHYSNGTMKCELCGEDRIKCLSIDHIGGGGAKHRKEIGKKGGPAFYRWLKRNKYPTGFRVLCMNCQFCTKF